MKRQVWNTTEAAVEGGFKIETDFESKKVRLFHWLLIHQAVDGAAEMQARGNLSSERKFAKDAARLPGSCLFIAGLATIHAIGRNFVRI